MVVDLKLLKEWLSGGLANALTSALLNPMDVLKTRSQINSVKAVDMAKILKGLYAEGGIVGLWSPGLLASCIRELLSSGPRAGFYVPVRDNLVVIFTSSKSRSINGDISTDDKEMIQSTFAVKALAAMITGTIGSVVANPIDVVKIRLMTNPKAYPSTLSAVDQIFRTEGFNGLYKGVVPSTLRGAFIAAGELATYDHAKHIIKDKFRLNEGFYLHSLASLVTGLVAATVAAPFDIVKTR